ncbi:hypothetical protein AAC387_Pa04g1748 [Persea americana]
MKNEMILTTFLKPQPKSREKTTSSQYGEWLKSFIASHSSPGEDVQRQGVKFPRRRRKEPRRLRGQR